MRHLLFPTTSQADAFVQDLQSQGAIRPEQGQTNFGRRGAATTGTMGAGSTDAAYNGGTADPAAEEAGEGAVEGTGVGAVVGAVAGVVATAATGGAAAIPILLGMTALGSGVGAGVGAIGGAVDADADGTGAYSDYNYTDEQYNRISSGTDSGGRAIAVDDSVPSDVVDAAAKRHGGEFV